METCPYSFLGRPLLPVLKILGLRGECGKNASIWIRHSYPKHRFLLGNPMTLPLDL
ncbi:hypothetical protein NPIL_506351, partial [Nephila pilipes]